MKIARLSPLHIKRLLRNGARLKKDSEFDPEPVVHLQFPREYFQALLTSIDPDQPTRVTGLFDDPRVAERIVQREEEFTVIPGRVLGAYCVNEMFKPRAKLSAYSRLARQLRIIDEARDPATDWGRVDVPGPFDHYVGLRVTRGKKYDPMTLGWRSATTPAQLRARFEETPRRGRELVIYPSAEMLAEHYGGDDPADTPMRALAHPDGVDGLHLQMRYACPIKTDATPADERSLASRMLRVVDRRLTPGPELSELTETLVRDALAQPHLLFAARLETVVDAVVPEAPRRRRF